MKLRPAEEAHLALLAKWRKAMDLVGPGALEPHFADAIAAVSWLRPTGRWADLGSGAGFPGVALAARHPGIRVTLVESRQRRAAFLDQVVAASELPNLEVFHGRTEALPDRSYDGVISRAYRPPVDYLQDATRLLVPGGSAILLVAQQDPPEVPDLEVFHVEHYAVEGRPRRAVGYHKSTP